MGISGAVRYALDPTGAATNAGGFAWYYLSTVNGLKWTLSASGTNEYYCELSAGGDPSLSTPGSLYLDGHGNLSAEGAVGSLAVGEWDYADNDTLGYSTIYVRLLDGSDPNYHSREFIGIGINYGTDYSQQAVAELTLANISSDVTGLIVTDDDAGGNVTAAMVDNLTFIPTTGGFTEGYYQIASITDANTFVVDRSCGVSGSGGSCKVGGSVSVLKDAFFEQLTDSSTASNIVHQSGNIPLTESIIVSNGGNSSSHLQFIGHNTTRGDEPVGTDRPLIACGAYYLAIFDYWDVKHIRTTGTATQVLGGNGNINQTNFVNCSAVNSSVTPGRLGFSIVGALGDMNRLVDCYGESTVGTAIRAYASDLLRCVAANSGIGFSPNYLATFIRCISYANTDTGFTIGNYRDTLINCIAHDCTNYGVSMVNTNAVMIDSVAISDCGTGIYSTGGKINKTSIIDYLNIYNCTIASDGVDVGTNSTAIDPGYTDPDNGNFKPVGGNLITARAFPGGLTDDSYLKGAVSTEGAGGGGYSFGYVS